MNDTVVIRSDALTAAIDPMGAELVSLKDSAGREYMTDADPRWWTGHAPILFPIVGALNNGTYRLDGAEYALAKHGFARTSRFGIETSDAARVQFRLRDSEATRVHYPFAFTLDIDFALEGAALRITATVTNRDQQAMQFSFGFHPAFAWPLPGSAAKDAHRVVFAKDEPAPIRRIDTKTLCLRTEPQRSPVEGKVLSPKAELFEADALIWDRLESRSLTFGAPGGAALKLDFPDCPNLGIWQKPGAPFLALEPWHGYNDPQGFEGDFREKPGVLSLPPGDSHEFRLSIEVSPPENPQ